MTAATRAAVIARIADVLAERRLDHPLRVAVDGVTAAGKTTLADELASAVRARGRAVLRVSMDGFHNPRVHRYRQGRDSAAGYYQDAYNFGALATAVLVPLGPGGDRRYRARVHDLASDKPVDDDPVQAPPDAVLIVDGSFLQRAELDGLWDEVVFVDTAFSIARARAVLRDTPQFDSATAVEQVYERRYHAASRLYLAEYAPVDRATFVIGNDNLDAPVLRRGG
jgi:uridine kinase